MTNKKAVNDNINFKINDKVACTWGSNKNKIFIIEKIINNGYICISDIKEDSKKYYYNDRFLKAYN